MADPKAEWPAPAVLVGRLVVWTTLAAGCALLYMRLCSILEEGFVDMELKPNLLPQAYKSKSMLSVIIEVVIRQVVAVVVVSILSAIAVFCIGGNFSRNTLKSELLVYVDAMSKSDKLKTSCVTARVKNMIERMLCTAPCVFVVVCVPLSILSHHNWFIGQGALALTCEPCFKVACSCDAPFLQNPTQHKEFSGERMPEMLLEAVDDSMQGRCETAGTTSLELPTTCTLTSSEDYQCPHVNLDSWRHEWLTTQRENLPQEPEINMAGSEMLYELGPAFILFVMLVLATVLYLQKLKDGVRDDAVEIQDELFPEVQLFCCFPMSSVHSSCNHLHSLFCCLCDASLAQVLRVRIAFLALYFLVVCLVSIVGTEQRACYDLPLVFGSLDECSATGQYSLIIARSCNGAMNTGFTLDLFSQYLKTIVMHCIVLPCIVIPETIAKVIDHMRYQTAKDRVEEIHPAAVSAFMEDYDLRNDDAEASWDYFLEPILEAFDPFCLVQAPSKTKDIVKLAMIQRLSRNFEKYLVELRNYPGGDAQLYGKYLRIYLKTGSETEETVKHLLQYAFHSSRDAAHANLESNVLAMLPDRETAIGKGFEHTGRLHRTQSCCTRGCPRDSWNREPGECCCRSCFSTNGASHGLECQQRFTRKVNQVFAVPLPTDEGIPKAPHASRKARNSRRRRNSKTREGIRREATTESVESSLPDRPVDVAYSGVLPEIEDMPATPVQTFGTPRGTSMAERQGMTDSPFFENGYAMVPQEDTPDVKTPDFSGSWWHTKEDRPEPPQENGLSRARQDNMPESLMEGDDRWLQHREVVPEAPSEPPPQMEAIDGWRPLVQTDLHRSERVPAVVRHSSMPKRKAAPRRFDSDRESASSEDETPVKSKALVCATPGCTRIPWNSQAGGFCCRTCPKTGGKTHGPVCDQTHLTLPQLN